MSRLEATDTSTQKYILLQAFVNSTGALTEIELRTEMEGLSQQAFRTTSHALAPKHTAGVLEDCHEKGLVERTSSATWSITDLGKKHHVEMKQLLADLPRFAA